MSSIMCDQQGTYRWAYEFNLWKNPTILITILKVLGGVFLALFVFIGIVNLFEGYTSAEDMLANLRVAGIILLVMLGITLLGYAIYALMVGGSYCVVFTMNERGIEHRQLPEQFKKAQVMGGLSVLSGLASGNLSQMGLGLLTATNDARYSDFANVRSIQGLPRRGTIKVNEPLSKNQVYVDPEDYDFVFAYIRAHCPNATVKG